MWTRRGFLAGVGALPLAACERTRTKDTGMAPPTPPTREGPGTYIQYDPGFSATLEPAPFVFDGEALVEVRDGAVIRRDARFAERGRLAIAEAARAVVLADGSLAVLAGLRSKKQVHHVVGDAVVASATGMGDAILATEDPATLWMWDRGGASGLARVQFGSGALAGTLVPTASYELPDGLQPAWARQLDGSIVLASQSAISRATATELTRYAWAGFARHVGAGPDARLVWCADRGTNQVALVALEGAGASARAVATATHALRTGEALVDFAAAGDVAAAVVARPGAPTVFTLVGFDARGERWRAPLGDVRRAFHVAVSATRVVVRTEPGGELAAWLRDTGAPA